MSKKKSLIASVTAMVAVLSIAYASFRDAYIDTLSNTVRIGYFPNISHSQAFVETTLWINGHQEETEKVINGRLKALVGRELPADVVHEAFSNMQVTYDPMKLSLVNLVDEVYELGMLGREKLDLSGIYYATLLNEVLNEKNLFVVK